jgi:hypothetical protein
VIHRLDGDIRPNLFEISFLDSSVPTPSFSAKQATSQLKPCSYLGAVSQKVRLRLG